MHVDEPVVGFTAGVRCRQGHTVKGLGVERDGWDEGAAIPLSLAFALAAWCAPKRPGESGPMILLLPIEE
jgi:hypothetical protein